MGQWLKRVRARKAGLAEREGTPKPSPEAGPTPGPLPSELAKGDMGPGLRKDQAVISSAPSDMPKGEGPEPSRWSRLADSGLRHSDVQDLAQVLFLFAIELIGDPDRGQFPGDLPRTWGHYAPFWKERLPNEAFEGLERRYKLRLHDLGLQDEARLHGPKTLRPLVTYARPFWQRPDGSCFVCGSRRSWRSIHGVVVCAVCHPPTSPDLVVALKMHGLNWEGELVGKKEARWAN